MTSFLIIVLSIWAAMHLYVFWRLASLPWVAAHVSRPLLVLAALALGASYPVARLLQARNLEALATPLEFAAANWIGILFLVCSALLVADVLTAGGWLFPRYAAAVRGGAVAVAGLLSLVALVQGLRAPVLRDYEVALPGLPPERDGLTLVQISDLHLGTLLGQRWLTRLVERVNALRPDLVAVVGDVIDGNARRVEPLQPILKRLQAPLGVWAVTGNHEYYAGVEACTRLFEAAGFTVLRDRAVEVVPGLTLAGIDDLTARQQFGLQDRPLERALANPPAGATILLSHSPWEAQRAAAAGVDLMLSGHTHDGQLWPFKYLVGLRYPLLAGRYQVDGMPVIVCRGTGTWGPRMRLWRPAEIVRIRLRTPAKAGA